MSISDKITRLQTAKEDIADAITSKGGTVVEGDGFEDFANDISSIPSGGGDLTSVIDGTITSIDIPSDVSYAIRPYAFKGCYGLQTVNIPEGVYRIGQSAFEDCSNLFYHKDLGTKLIIPSTCSEIQYRAFANTSVRNIYIPRSCETIGQEAFDGIYAMTINYQGSTSDWNNMNIGTDAIPSDATIYYNSYL